MNTKSSHSIFPNPTVVEAIIEVHLGTFLTEESLNTIFDGLKSSYQESHRDHLVSYQAAVGERGISISQDKLPGQLRLQFKSIHNNFLVQIFSDKLSVHKTENYDG